MDQLVCMKVFLISQALVITAFTHSNLFANYRLTLLILKVLSNILNFIEIVLCFIINELEIRANFGSWSIHYFTGALVPQHIWSRLVELA